jgi:hypothetical protein
MIDSSPTADEERLMSDQDAQKTIALPDEMDEKLRRDTIRALEPYGLRLISDLATMSEAEAVKWFVWNLHENLDELRKLEPTLIGHVVSSQLTVCDGQSMWTECSGLEKRLEFRCNWSLLLKYPTYQSEEAYQLGEGWIDLFIGSEPPPRPVLAPEQKGYLHADSPLFPNQIFLYGWIGTGVWDEIKPQLHHPNADCQTDIFLRDNFLFPVKSGFDFVTGPAGAIGITNLEIRVTSHVRPNTWVKNK